MSDAPLPSMTSADFTPAIERARLQAIVDRDMEVVDSLHADDYELITPGAGRFRKSGTSATSLLEL